MVVVSYLSKTRITVETIPLDKIIPRVSVYDRHKKWKKHLKQAKFTMNTWRQALTVRHGPR